MTSKVTKKEAERIRLEHNEKRRVKYAQDPEYRKIARAKQIQNYRKKQEFVNCTHIAVTDTDELAEIGTVRSIEGEDVITFNTTEYGQAMGGYTRQLIAKWVNKGRISPMIYKGKAVDERGPFNVYTLEEVQAMAEILYEHQQSFCYYTKHHKDVKKQLIQAVEDLR